MDGASEFFDLEHELDDARDINAKWLRLARALFDMDVDEKECPYCEKVTRAGEHCAGCALNAIWLMIDEIDPT